MKKLGEHTERRDILGPKDRTQLNTSDISVFPWRAADCSLVPMDKTHVHTKDILQVSRQDRYVDKDILRHFDNNHVYYRTNLIKVNKNWFMRSVNILAFYEYCIHAEIHRHHPFYIALEWLKLLRNLRMGNPLASVYRQRCPVSPGGRCDRHVRLVDQSWDLI